MSRTSSNALLLDRKPLAGSLTAENVAFTTFVYWLSANLLDWSTGQVIAYLVGWWDTHVDPNDVLVFFSSTSLPVA